MLPLPERLERIAEILEYDNADLMERSEADETGYVPVPPKNLAESVLKLLAVVQPPMRSLDLGCGNGGWMLMAAAAGFPSYGIEINPLLVEHARRNYEECLAQGLIDPRVPCEFVVGDMIPPRHRASYAAYVRSRSENPASMPQSGTDEEQFTRLGLSIATADIIYCWAWPAQSRFIFNMLGAEAKPDAVFVLPCYMRYTQGEHMNQFFKEQNELFLIPVAPQVRDVFIGKR